MKTKVRFPRVATSYTADNTKQGYQPRREPHFPPPVATRGHPGVHPRVPRVGIDDMVCNGQCFCRIKLKQSATFLAAPILYLPTVYSTYRIMALPVPDTAVYSGVIF